MPAALCLGGAANAQSPAVLQNQHHHHHAHHANATTAPAGHGLIAADALPPDSEETIRVKVPPLPAVQIYPHGGVIGQPRRVLPSQTQAPTGHQGQWGKFNRGTGEVAGFGPVGRYGLAPWAEDWSSLRDPKNRTDFLDPLKFIALNDAKTIWITLSGESWFRNWFDEHPQFGTRPNTNSGRITVHNLLGADLHLGSHVRLFGQLVNGEAGGWNGFGYNGTYRKRLDAQQAFIEFKENILGAKTGFMFGRQQFLDAPTYLLYNRNNPNVPLSWNGFRSYALWNSIRIDGYDFVGTNTRPTQMFHDTEDYTSRLYGFDTTIAIPEVKLGAQTLHSYLDLFYIGFKYASSAAAIATRTGTRAGTATRNNFGFRWFGSAAPFEYSLGYDYQGGAFNQAKSTLRRSVAAYSVNSSIGFRAPGSSLHPFIGIQADIYSGGNVAKQKGPVGTFTLPFNPQTNYLDYTTYIAPSNLVSFSPIVQITPIGWASLRIKAPVMWRERETDAVYSSSGRYAFSTHLTGRYTGVVPQARLLLQLTNHISLQLLGARFIVSQGMRKAGAHSGSYGQSTLQFRF